MNKVFIFVLGAAIGSVVTWKYIDEKYRKMADDEIESVKKLFKEKEAELKKVCDEKAEAIYEVFKDNKKEYIDNTNEYVSNDDDCVIKVEESQDYIAPYVIEAEEYGSDEDYKLRSFMYYSDFVLADEDEDIVFEPEKLIGDALEQLGEYDEFIYVRNDNTKEDYEILRSEKTYTEANYKGVN